MTKVYDKCLYIVLFIVLLCLLLTGCSGLKFKPENFNPLRDNNITPAGILDTASTYYAVHKGGDELNPLITTCAYEDDSPLQIATCLLITKQILPEVMDVFFGERTKRDREIASSIEYAAFFSNVLQANSPETSLAVTVPVAGLATYFADQHKILKHDWYQYPED